MVLRLLMVSMVAGLGVTAPEESALAGWSQSVQSWLDAQLAEWATEPAVGTAAVPAIAAAVAADPGYEIYDEELKALLGQERGADAPVLGQPANAVADPGSSEWHEEERALAGGVPVTDEPAPPIGDSPVAQDRAFLGVVEEMVADFARATPGTHAAEASAVAVTEEAAQRERELADALLADFAPSAIVAEPSLTSLPAGEEEPLELRDDFDQARAFESSGVEEALGSPATRELEVPSGRSAGHPLSDAVRLTRDAVYAWINLLQSPAIVTLPQ